MGRQTHYCHTPFCRGNDGFSVQWVEDSWDEPGYPVQDTCPFCGDGMADQPLYWEDLIDGVLDNIPRGHKQIKDKKRLAMAIYRELGEQGVDTDA